MKRIASIFANTLASSYTFFLFYVEEGDQKYPSNKKDYNKEGKAVID